MVGVRKIRVAVRSADPLDAVGLAATLTRHALLVTDGPADVLVVAAAKAPGGDRSGTPVVLVTDDEPDPVTLSRTVVLAVPRVAATGERFVALIRAAAAGQSWRDPDGEHLTALFRSLAGEYGRPRLPGPELELLRLAADGLSTAEISAVTGRSRRAVREAFDDIVSRLELRNVRHAIAHAIRNGEI